MSCGTLGVPAEACRLGLSDVANAIVRAVAVISVRAFVSDEGYGPSLRWQSGRRGLPSVVRRLHTGDAAGGSMPPTSCAGVGLGKQGRLTARECLTTGPSSSYDEMVADSPEREHEAAAEPNMASSAVRAVSSGIGLPRSERDVVRVSRTGTAQPEPRSPVRSRIGRGTAPYSA